MRDLPSTSEVPISSCLRDPYVVGRCPRFSLFAKLVRIFQSLSTWSFHVSIASIHAIPQTVGAQDLGKVSWSEVPPFDATQRRERSYQPRPRKVCCCLIGRIKPLNATLGGTIYLSVPVRLSAREPLEGTLRYASAYMSLGLCSVHIAMNSQ